MAVILILCEQNLDILPHVSVFHEVCSKNCCTSGHSVIAVNQDAFGIDPFSNEIACVFEFRQHVSVRHVGYGNLHQSL